MNKRMKLFSLGVLTIFIIFIGFFYTGEKTVVKKIIQTDNAPKAIGTYSQAVQVGNTVYLSGQIPLSAKTGQLVEGDIQAQIKQVFENIKAVCIAAGGDLQDIVKVNVYLTDLKNFADVNTVMAEYIKQPYPARAAVEVSALPKGAQVEIEAVMVLS